MTWSAARRHVDSLLGAQTEPAIGLSYALRTAVAAALGYWIFWALHPHISLWAVISAVVVIQPDNRASISNAALRVIANILGVCAGVAIAAVVANPLVALVAGMLTVTWLCHALRIDGAARTANVAITIVLLTDPSNVFGSSELRVLGVLVGCVIGLVVTVAAAGIQRALGADAQVNSDTGSAMPGDRASLTLPTRVA